MSSPDNGGGGQRRSPRSIIPDHNLSDGAKKRWNMEHGTAPEETSLTLILPGSGNNTMIEFEGGGLPTCKGAPKTITITVDGFYSKTNQHISIGACIQEPNGTLYSLARVVERTDCEVGSVSDNHPQYPKVEAVRFTLEAIVPHYQNFHKKINVFCEFLDINDMVGDLKNYGLPGGHKRFHVFREIKRMIKSFGETKTKIAIDGTNHFKIDGDDKFIIYQTRRLDIIGGAKGYKVHEFNHRVLINKRGHITNMPSVLAGRGELAWTKLGMPYNWNANTVPFHLNYWRVTLDRNRSQQQVHKPELLVSNANRLQVAGHRESYIHAQPEIDPELADNFSRQQEATGSFGSAVRELAIVHPSLSTVQQGHLALAPVHQHEQMIDPKLLQQEIPRTVHQPEQIIDPKPLQRTILVVDEEFEFDPDEEVEDGSFEEFDNVPNGEFDNVPNGEFDNVPNGEFDDVPNEEIQYDLGGMPFL